MERTCRIALCLTVAAALLLLAVGCTETGEVEEVSIYGSPAAIDDQLPDDVAEMWKRSTLLDRSTPAGEEAQFIGDDWQVRTSHYLGDFDVYVEEIDDEGNVVEGELEYLRTEVSYLALATYEVETHDNLRVKAGIVRKNRCKDRQEDSGGGFREFEQARVVNPDGEPTTVLTELKPLGRELWECPEAGAEYLTMEIFCLVVGWINRPEVSEFAIRFSDGRSATLNAETHQYFVGVLSHETFDFPVDEGRPHTAFDEITVREVTAYDEDGDVIE